MQKQNPWAVFGLGLITFGFYHVHWLIRNQETLTKNNYQNLPDWLLWVCYPLILFVQLINPEEPSAFVGLLYVLSIPAWVYLIMWLYKFAQGLNKATNDYISTAVGFLVPLALGTIGSAYLQSQINKFLEGAPRDTGLAPEQNKGEQQ